MELKEQLKGMSAQDRKALLAELQAEENQAKAERRETYEALRKDFMGSVKQNVVRVADIVALFSDWLCDETEGFRSVMEEYGQFRRQGQASYTLTEGDFRLEVSHNKVKRFDERADIASERLTAYLQDYILRTDKGTEDPLYQLAMTLLQRNRKGDLDYKNISKLYEMEDKFDEEYRSIMQLFREAHVVEDTRTNFYFFQRDNMGVWRKIEPSFNRY